MMQAHSESNVQYFTIPTQHTLLLLIVHWCLGSWLLSHILDLFFTPIEYTERDR